MMRTGVVVFAGLFGAFAAATWFGCSSTTAPSTFHGSDAAAEAGPCEIDPMTGSLADCTCSSLVDYCANASCPLTLADAEDAGSWTNAGTEPNCIVKQSTNTCSGEILVENGGVDTADQYFYDSTTGALVGVAHIINLQSSCGGKIPGNCDDTWTLAPIFGVLDAGSCFTSGSFDAGIADAAAE